MSSPQHPRLCSFLPAATQTIYDLGLQHLLHGVTFECPAPARSEKERVVRCVLEEGHHSSAEIDRIFSESKREGRSLYYVDEEALARIAPDIIFTQDVCEVCQIDTACTEAAVARLPRKPRLIPLSPDGLDDVYATVTTIAAAAGAPERGAAYLQGLMRRKEAVLDTLRAGGAPLRQVSLLEWMEPIFNCGHWIPFQISAAGGTDMLANPAGDSVVIAWERLRRYDPEVLIVAPCGFSVARSAEEAHLLTGREGWSELTAVKSGQVYLLDFDLFTQPSAGTLTDGIELLAALFHPHLFAVPQHLQHKYRSLESASHPKNPNPLPAGRQGVNPT